MFTITDLFLKGISQDTYFKPFNLSLKAKYISQVSAKYYITGYIKTN